MGWKIRPGLLTLVIFMAILAEVLGAGRCWAAPLEVNARAAILMDADSGRVLYSSNPDLRLPMASTTKITTALVALERGNLADMVRTSKNAAETPESSFLTEGEQLSLENMLYALLLLSANDAAEAIAEHVGGTSENFVDWMNERARELGATDTHYVNPHGLDAPDHYSTAYDLAVVTRQALTIPEFRRIIVTPERKMPWAGYSWDHQVFNHNLLVVGSSAYLGAYGVKTGFTREAGSCLVGAAERGNLNLIAVVLNCPNMYEQVKSMLDYGFNNFSCRLVAAGDRSLATLKVDRGFQESVPVLPEKEVMIPVLPGEEQQVVATVSLPERMEAPVSRGEVVGTLHLRVGQEVLPDVNLIAGQSISRRPFWSYFWEALGSIFSLA